MRKSRMSSIGDSRRSSRKPNETRSTAAAAKRPTTPPLDQPQSLPRSRPSTSANRPPVSVIRPATSKLPASSSRVSCRTRSPAATHANPIGMLTEEDPAPADVRRQRAPDERPDRYGRTDRRPPDAEGCATFTAVKLLRDDRERDGEHRGAADSLHTPRHDQPVRRLRRAAQGRCQREEGDPAEEDTLASSYVAERAGVEQRRREGKCIGVDHPLQIGEGGVQLLVDVRQRDVDYGDVEGSMKTATHTTMRSAPFPLH